MLRRFFLISSAAAGLLGSVSSCDMKKDIEVALPAYDHKPVVECYLENDSTYRLLLTETSAYFDGPIPAAVRNATVTITHHGQTDTLQELTTLEEVFDPISKKAYNYVKRVPVQATNGDVFSLVVKDQKGRTVTGTTTFRQPVAIDSIRLYFQGDTVAAMQTFFYDPGHEENYYRYIVHKNTPLGDRMDDDLGSDNLINGRYASFNSGYRFHPGDTLVVTLFSLEKQYYEFLRSVREANNANGNPFAQPATIRNTVSGGMGVFTNLVYDRRVVIVP